jgi:CcmD family protein
MSALVTAYVAVWLGVTLTIGRLAARQRQLSDRVTALETQLDACERRRDPVQRAA